jgi:lipopolysaccharide transport system ATP-binding protein
MTDAAIRSEGLAKQYRIGERESYKALRDVITDAFASPFRRLRSVLRHSSNGRADSEKPNIWALTDVSFEIKRGEVVGIIGRNGAGKSTLLKILSRITEPTHGYVDIWGRVGSLLEVGTGFHPELTGRDNIFLNGAILGMKKAEIALKFDEIVAFAEVEKFLDTPVKRYSSGMYVRLAFAVAAHMDTEILLVDEVLAVGDAEFQKKCLGKMGDVARHGRTVLLVSHNMAAMRSLCTRVMYLNGGRVKMDGEANAIVDAYASEATAVRDTSGVAWETPRFFVDGVDCEGQSAGSPLLPLRPAVVRIRVRCKLECPDLTVRFAVEEQDGHRLIGIDTWTMGRGVHCPALEPRVYEVRFSALPLAPGNYIARIWLASYLIDMYEELPSFIPFEVHEGPVPGCNRHRRGEHGVLATGVVVSGMNSQSSKDSADITWHALRR